MGRVVTRRFFPLTLKEVGRMHFMNHWVSNATVTVIMSAANKALNAAHGGFAAWAGGLFVKPLNIRGKHTT